MKEKSNKSISFTFRYDSEEMLTLAENHLMVESHPDKIHVDTMVAYPGGVRREIKTNHKVSDYFDGINIVPNIFLRWITIEFFPKKEKHFWKDIAVRMLMSIKMFGGIETKQMVNFNS